MTAVRTTSASPHVESSRRDGSSFQLGLAALLFVLAAITAVTVSGWQSSSGPQSPTLSRVVGPDTFVDSVYHQQVPAAARR